MDTKIVFRIGGNKIELTPEEAMELKQALNDMFKDEQVVYYPSVPYFPQYPLQPLYDGWYTTSDAPYTTTRET